MSDVFNPVTKAFVPLVVPRRGPQGTAETKSAVQPSLEAHSHRPTLEVEREGEHVKRLLIRCGCGETIVVDCVE